MYYAVWKGFNKFFIRLDNKPETWEDRIILYVAFLIEGKRSSRTIKSYVSALKNILQDDGVELNEDRFLLNAMTKACKLKNDRVTTRLPIRKGMLKLILQEVEKYYHNKKRTQPYLTSLYKALFSTAYFGLFRIGELATGTHPVRAKDVHVAKNKKKFLFVLRTSKTHGLYAAPQSVKISSHPQNIESNQEQLGECPYKLLRDYIALRPLYASPEEPFFVLQDKSPLKPDLVRKILKLLLKKAGFEEGLYSFHSFRAGRTVDLRKIGLKIDQLMELGRWSSSSIYTYLKHL